MSSRSKGMQYEREYAEYLEKIGYIVQRVKGSTKFNRNVDFFGLWDIIAFNNNTWVLIQVKTDYRKKVFDELKDWFYAKYPPRTVAFYVIRKKGKRGDQKWDVREVGCSITEKIRPIPVTLGGEAYVR